MLAQTRDRKKRTNDRFRKIDVGSVMEIRDSFLGHSLPSARACAGARPCRLQPYHTGAVIFDFDPARVDCGHRCSKRQSAAAADGSEALGPQFNKMRFGRQLRAVTASTALRQQTAGGFPFGAATGFGVGILSLDTTAGSSWL